MGQPDSKWWTRILAPIKTDYNESAPVGSTENPSTKILTLPNFVTILRIVLTFVFLYLFVSGQNRYVALTIYAIAACTDWVDGVLARTTNSVSWFGKVLDPLVDRILLFSGVLGLCMRGELPSWIAVVIIARDIYLGIGGAILYRYFRSRPIDVSYFGKITTALLLFGFCLMLFGQPIIEGLGWCNFPWLPVLNYESGCVGILFIYPAVILSYITAIVYTVDGVQSGLASLHAGRKL